MNQANNNLRNVSLVNAFLVVAIHCAGSADVGSSGWWFNQLMSWGIANMAVPFFFFASGYFAAKSFGQEGYWVQGIGKRVKTLLVPYFVWSILFFVWFLILRGVQSGLHGETAGLAHLLNWCVVPEILGLNPFEMPLLFPCWYVRALFVLFLLLPLFSWMSGTGWRFVFSLTIGVALLVLTRNLDGNWNSFFRLTLSIEGACYFLVGCYARRRDFCRVQTKGVACVAAAIVLVALVLRTFARAQGMQTSPWLDYALTPLMIFALMGIVSDRAWPSALTGISFGVFLIHPFVLAVLGVIVVWIGRWLKVDMSQMAGTRIVEWLVCCLVSVVLVNLLCRFCPRVATIVLGGRVCDRQVSQTEKRNERL